MKVPEAGSSLRTKTKLNDKMRVQLYLLLAIVAPAALAFSPPARVFAASRVPQRRGMPLTVRMSEEPQKNRRVFGREVGVLVQVALLASWGPGGGQIYEKLFPGFSQRLDARLDEAKAKQLERTEDAAAR